MRSLRNPKTVISSTPTTLARQPWKPCVQTQSGLNNFRERSFNEHIEIARLLRADEVDRGAVTRNYENTYFDHQPRSTRSLFEIRKKDHAKEKFRRPGLREHIFVVLKSAMVYPPMPTQLAPRPLERLAGRIHLSFRATCFQAERWGKDCRLSRRMSSGTSMTWSIELNRFGAS